MVPISQMVTVASYVLTQKLKGRKKYPLVLMLEPLFRCNLACAGCGKIQYPEHVLNRRLTPEQCWAAADECGTPMVAIPGGEPLIHPEIDMIASGFVARRKYVYLCTNALLLKRKLGLFKPSKYLSFSVHLDGLREHHDAAVCREGTYDIAVDAIKEAVKRGFRVTTNSTLFEGVKPAEVRRFFDEVMDLGVEGMMISPGYRYEKAPDQDHFLGVRQTQELFKKAFDGKRKHWRFNHSPMFLDFLEGKFDFDCTAWAIPSYSVFGWQRPCYLMADGYTETYRELVETTDWDRYGRGRDPRCENCMAHCGYESTAVLATTRSVKQSLRALAQR